MGGRVGEWAGYGPGGAKSAAGWGSGLVMIQLEQTLL